MTVRTDYSCGLRNSCCVKAELDAEEINALSKFVQRFENREARHDMEDTPDLENFNKEKRASAVELKKLRNHLIKSFLKGMGLRKKKILTKIIRKK